MTINKIHGEEPTPEGEEEFVIDGEKMRQTEIEIVVRELGELAKLRERRKAVVDKDEAAIKLLMPVIPPVVVTEPSEENQKKIDDI